MYIWIYEEFGSEKRRRNCNAWPGLTVGARICASVCVCVCVWVHLLLCTYMSVNPYSKKIIT